MAHHRAWNQDHVLLPNVKDLATMCSCEKLIIATRQQNGHQVGKLPKDSSQGIRYHRLWNEHAHQLRIRSIVFHALFSLIPYGEEVPSYYSASPSGRNGDVQINP